MKTRVPVILFVASLLLAALAAFAQGKAPGGNPVPYPEGYRSWTHVKSMWLGSKHALATPFAGLHHVYGNDAAVAALKSKKPFPKGAVLVFDLFEAPLDGEAIAEGKRKFTGVMHRDDRLYKETGGWGFEAFAQDSKVERLVNDKGTSCFACHQSRSAQDFVFTELR
jgi:hypothetical protein